MSNPLYLSFCCVPKLQACKVAGGIMNINFICSALFLFLYELGENKSLQFLAGHVLYRPNADMRGAANSASHLKPANTDQATQQP